jgi:hypothetical protein
MNLARKCISRARNTPRYEKHLLVRIKNGDPTNLAAPFCAKCSQSIPNNR